MALFASGSVSQSPPSNPCCRAAGKTESRETETSSSNLPGWTSAVATLAYVPLLLFSRFPDGVGSRPDSSQESRVTERLLRAVGRGGRGPSVEGIIRLIFLATRLIGPARC